MESGQVSPSISTVVLELRKGARALKGILRADESEMPPLSNQAHRFQTGHCCQLERVMRGASDVL